MGFARGHSIPSDVVEIIRSLPLRLTAIEGRLERIEERVTVIEGQRPIVSDADG